MRTLPFAIAVCSCATVASAQLPDAVVWARMDSASICPQVFVRQYPGAHTLNIETSPITTRVGGKDFALVVGAVSLPAGLGTTGIIQVMAMGEGPARYTAAHDIVILADDSIRIPVATNYEDRGMSPTFRMETIAGQMHSYDLARLANAKNITVNVGSESHALSVGQVQAVRALVKAMAEPMTEREVATGCRGPNRVVLQAKWDSLNSTLPRPVSRGTPARALPQGGSTVGQTYFEFQVEKPASVINHGAMLYPPQLKANNVSGRVLAQFVVLEDGTADMDTFKILSSTNDLFTQSVRLTVPGMRFSPAEIGGKKVRQLVQLPFDFALNRVSRDTAIALGPVLPPSLSQTVYSATQVDKPVRGQNGAALQTTIPPEVVAMFGGQTLLEFVVNADGSIDRSTIRVVSSTDTVMAAAVVKGFTPRFRPAELNGKSVRQLVRMAMPMGKNPFH